MQTKIIAQVEVSNNIKNKAIATILLRLNNSLQKLQTDIKLHENSSKQTKKTHNNSELPDSVRSIIRTICSEDSKSKSTTLTSNILKLQELIKALQPIEHLDDMLAILKGYSQPPPKAFNRALATVASLIPTFNKEHVFLYKEDDFLFNILKIRFDINGHFLDVNPVNVLDKEGIILINYNIADSYTKSISTLCHEEMHREVFRSNKLFSEGITTYKQSQLLQQLLVENKEYKKAILDANNPLLGLYFLNEELNGREVSREEIFKKVINNSLSYPSERTFVEALATKYGEEFIDLLAKTGDLSIFEEKMGKDLSIIFTALLKNRDNYDYEDVVPIIDSLLLALVSENIGYEIFNIALRLLDNTKDVMNVIADNVVGVDTFAICGDIIKNRSILYIASYLNHEKTDPKNFDDIYLRAIDIIIKIRTGDSIFEILDQAILE